FEIMMQARRHRTGQFIDKLARVAQRVLFVLRDEHDAVALIAKMTGEVEELPGHVLMNEEIGSDLVHVRLATHLRSAGFYTTGSEMHNRLPPSSSGPYSARAWRLWVGPPLAATVHLVSCRAVHEITFPNLRLLSLNDRTRGPTEFFLRRLLKTRYRSRAKNVAKSGVNLRKSALQTSGMNILGLNC